MSLRAHAIGVVEARNELPKGDAKPRALITELAGTMWSFRCTIEAYEEDIIILRRNALFPYAQVDRHVTRD